MISVQVDDLISFRDNFTTSRQQIISNHEILVTEERNNLGSEVLRLENEISLDKLEIQQKLIAELKLLRRKSGVSPWSDEGRVA